MRKPTQLNDEQVSETLAGLSGWKLTDGKLHRDFELARRIDTLA